ncbi:MAG: tetratricopeptide repeat protein [Terriglobia bacterium]
MASRSIRKCLGWALALMLLLSAAPLMAQTGGVVGNVTGANGEKLVKYPVIIARQDVQETYKTKTDKHGHYIYIGLPIGQYKVTLEDPEGHTLFYIQKHIGLGDPTEVDFDLAKEKGAQDALAAVEIAKQNAALQQSFQQATALYNQQKYPEAAQAFADLVPKVSPKDVAGILFDEGTSYAKAANFDKAAQAYQQAIDKEPDNKQYHGALAEADVKLGKTQEAEQEFKKAGMSVDLKAIQQNSQVAKENQAFKNLKQAFDNATSLYKSGQYPQAAQTFEQAAAVAKGKNLPIVLAQAGDSWDKAKEYDKSVADYQKAITTDPTNAGYVNSLGAVYNHMGKPDLALQQFQKAAQMDPAGAARYYFNMGAVEMNSGKADEAAADFKKATTIDPNDADAYFEEAQALLGKATTGADGKVVPAPGTVEALQQYLKVAPNGQYAAQAQQMLDTLTGKVTTTYRKH